MDETREISSKSDSSLFCTNFFDLGNCNQNVYAMDPLSKPDFDPVTFINSAFPDEASLSGLDTFLLGISTQMKVLEDEISHAVQMQSISGQQASIQILAAHEDIGQLFAKMTDIRKKATNSEKVVQEMCADIKKLDIAKTHLQTSITSLKRLQMLITAVGQLELLAQDLHYKDAANLMDAVKQLMASFEQAAYANIPIIVEIKDRISAIQLHLKKHAHRAFREIGQLVESVAAPSAQEMMSELPGTMKGFSDACLVVDSLGIAARRELLEEFVQVQLVPYEKLFAHDKQHCNLDQVERRWAWFKRLLKSIDTKFGNICPSHWRLALRLCLEFTERTKQHLVSMLSHLEASDSMDVHSLLKALQSTLRFEQEMSSRFEADIPMTGHSHATRDKGAKPTKFYNKTQALDSEKLKEDGQVMYIPTDHSAVTGQDEEEAGFLRLARETVIGEHGISKVFDKFLGSYVILERQNLEDMLNKLSQEEDTADSNKDSEGNTLGHNVYGSAMSMFVFIKNSIKRCTAFSKGVTFLALSKELKACMHQYGGLLQKRCPLAEKVPSLLSGGQSSTFYPLVAGAEKGICYLINTGEYCTEVVPQLEQMMKNKINPDLADKVNFASEVDLFMDLVAHALKVLVSGIMLRVNDAFREMASLNWSGILQVSEESAYVRKINAVLMEAMPTIRTSLGEGYFNMFCTKLASAVLDTYLDVIMKQKRITEVGTQQLLLDVYNIKTVLTHIHNLGSTADPASSSPAAPPPKRVAPPLYAKLVTSRTGHIETILKLIGTPDEQGMLLERFRIMWPDGKAADLQAVMQLKGVSRQNQVSLLEAFGLSASAAASFHQDNASEQSQPSSSYVSSSAAAAKIFKYGSDLSGSFKKLGLTASSQAK